MAEATARRARTAASALTTVALLVAGGLAFRPDVQSAERAGYRDYLDRSGEPLVIIEIDGRAAPVTRTVATAGIQGTIAALPTETAQLLVAAIGGQIDDSALQVERSYSTELAADGSIRSTTVLAVLGSDGYSTGVIAESSGTALVFSPPRIELPTSIGPGVTWVSEGILNFDRAFVYRGAISAAGPYDGRRCVAVESSLEQQNPDSGPYSRTTRSTWCQGWGTVDGSVAGMRFRRTAPGSVRLGPVAPPAPQPLAVGTVLRAPFPNSDVSVRPVVMGGLIISAKSSVGDLRAVHPTAAGQQVAWVHHPGGEVLGMTGDDSLLFVTTAQRLLAAFDAGGRIHWLTRLPDAAVGSPARVGDLVVVALLDGKTQAYDRDSGEQRWSVSSNDTIAVPPIASGAQVVSADVSGRIRAVRIDGSTAWSDSVPGVHAPMTALPDGGMLIQDSEGTLHAFDSTGGVRWTAEFDQSVVGEGSVLGPVAVLPTEAALVGVRLHDGSAAWRLGISGRAVVGPDGGFAAEGVAGRLGPDGTRLEGFGLPAGVALTSRTLWPLTVGDQFLAMEANGSVIAVGGA